MQFLGLGRIGLGQHAPAVTRRLGDPARQIPGVLTLEPPGQRLDRAGVLAQTVQQRLAVVQEDVHPDMRICPGHAGHVAKRSTHRGERIVPVDAARTRLVGEQVRECVGQVAGQRHQPIVGIGVDRHRPGAEPGHVSVHGAVRRRVGRGPRGHEPGGALEQSRAGVGHAARLGAAHGVAAHELRMVADRADHAALGRSDVGHRGRVGRRLERLCDQVGQHGDRPGHEHDVGTGARLGDARRGTVDRAGLQTLDQSLRVLVERGHDVAAASGGEADRTADQAQADDADVHCGSAAGTARCISSASRNARSSD